MKKTMNNLEEWIASRPPSVQALAKKYPPGTRFMGHSEILYVVGFTEQGHILVSSIDPKKDYEKAVETRVHLCNCCVEKLEEMRCEWIQKAFDNETP